MAAAQGSVGTEKEGAVGPLQQPRPSTLSDSHEDAREYHLVNRPACPACARAPSAHPLLKPPPVARLPSLAPRHHSCSPSTPSTAAHPRRASQSCATPLPSPSLSRSRYRYPRPLHWATPCHTEEHSFAARPRPHQPLPAPRHRLSHRATALPGDSKRSQAPPWLQSPLNRERHQTADSQSSPLYHNSLCRRPVCLTAPIAAAPGLRAQNVTTAAEWRRARNAQVRECLTTICNLQYPGPNCIPRLFAHVSPHARA